MAALPEDERAALARIISRILREPSDCDIGEPHQMVGEGFTVIYEIDEHLIAQVTTFHRLGGYPSAM